ncbi:MAG: N-acetylmuramoyl-L-alanine amidase [Verrucomicrobiota bacterium]
MLLACLAADASAQTGPATIAGSLYQPLSRIAASLGMDAAWAKKGEEIHLSSQWTRMRFTLHKRWFYLNGERVFIGNPIALHRGMLMISQRDFETTIRPLLQSGQFTPVPKLYHIVIDPGHGGKDPGAENRRLGINESKLALDLAQRLKRKLSGFGYKVSLTRENNSFVSLGRRPAMANQAQADLFISLHFNAVGDASVAGVETYVMTPSGLPSTNSGKLTASAKRTYPGNADNTWSLLAGYYMQSAMVRNLSAKDRGLKRARFAVLRDLNCPGVLIEGGFLTNSAEAQKLKSGAYRDKLANALVEGILLYQKKLNRLRGKE